MKIFKTTPEQQMKVYEIALAMRANGVDTTFITQCVRHALEYQGTHDLMVLWRKSKSKKDRSEIIADLQDELDIHTEKPLVPTKKPNVRFDDLEAIAKNVEGYKKNLRRLVDQKGGISVLAKKTGIPQPSLSRFFNSVALPRRTTLYKIAGALGLSEDQVITDWVA
jgi:DNA-binding phage protein